jgi:hypothetical protein
MTMGHDKSTYLAWRRRFEPQPIKLIIVAESPPKSGKYFYVPEGSRGEPLFAAMMQQLKATPEIKVEGLREFQKRGLMLVDATYEPVNDRRPDSERTRTILRDYPLLEADLLELAPDRSVPIIVIKAPLCDLLVPRLKADGFNVLNDKIRPPFPSTGQQPKFHERFDEILRSAAITL